MRQLKNTIIVKAIGIIVLSALVWTIGYLSGLEIGQKRAEQKLSQENQNQNNESGNQVLPQMPTVSGNQGTAPAEQLPQIPEVK